MTTKKKKAEKAKEESNLNIIAATIKDGFCQYDYVVKAGEQNGDKVKVKGHGLYMPSMTDAFHKLKFHLACVDEVFKHKDIEIKSVAKMHNHEIIADYFVEGFKIKGEEGDEHIVLIGTKKVSSGGMMEITTPPIPVDTYSSYEWHKDLKSAIDTCREEVIEYKNGNYTEMEVVNDDNQLTLGNGEETEDKLEEARV